MRYAFKEQIILIHAFENDGLSTEPSLLHHTCKTIQAIRPREAGNKLAWSLVPPSRTAAHLTIQTAAGYAT